MAPIWQRVSYPRALLGVLCLAVLASLVYGGLTSGTAFGAYNADWEGVTQFRGFAAENGNGARVIQGTDEYRRTEADKTLSVIMSPDKQYTQSDVTRIREFVRDGGTVLIAEDIGNASNPLLAQIGADARFDGGLLRDERVNDRTPAMPIATDITQHTYTRGVNRLTLNRGTAVEPNGARVLAGSSNFSYIDRNLNDKLDQQERLQSYPVVAVESVGNGTVILVGDPSLFINAMLKRSGNEQFARNVATEHETVLFDISQTERVPPLVAGRLFLQRTSAAQAFVGLVFVVGIVYWRPIRDTLLANYRRFVGQSSSSLELEPTSDRDTIEAWIRARHPDWEQARVQRVTDAIASRRHDRQDTTPSDDSHQQNTK